ncbi:MAG: hypothetical protein Q9191_004180 [Dirinaria sp. TL-2023a]
MAGNMQIHKGGLLFEIGFLTRSKREFVTNGKNSWPNKGKDLHHWAQLQQTKPRPKNASDIRTFLEPLAEFQMEHRKRRMTEEASAEDASDEDATIQPYTICFRGRCNRKKALPDSNRHILKWGNPAIGSTSSPEETTAHESSVFSGQEYIEAAQGNLVLLALAVLSRGQRFGTLGPALDNYESMEAMRKTVIIFMSIFKKILKSLIAGTLQSDKINNAILIKDLADVYNVSGTRPTIYTIALVDKAGKAPCARDVRQALTLMTLYCKNHGFEDLSREQRQQIMSMDTALPGFSIPWFPKDLKIRYIRAHLNPDRPTKDQWPQALQSRVDVITAFCERLSEHLNTLNPTVVDRSISFPLTYIGCTCNFPRRLDEHRTGGASCYTMKIMFSALATLYPDKYILDGSVVMLPWEKGQARIAESVIAQLTNSYARYGTGINIAAPKSNHLFEKKTTDEQWRAWKDQATVKLLGDNPSKSLYSP